jgi:hypothetical protein
MGAADARPADRERSRRVVRLRTRSGPRNRPAWSRPSYGVCFVAGLLTGGVLGAGLGILFAPAPGAELRRQIARQAGGCRQPVADAVES